ncbi:MAG: hypothetical protein Q4B35_02665 [Slackia sp.]|nr:hypothetical protein [Slackia sp.]
MDILPDNVEECRERLYGIVESEAKAAIKKHVEQGFLDAVRFVLQKNILCGDALTLKDADDKPIRFAEWSIVTGDKVKRRDYLLSELLEGANDQQSLFGDLLGERENAVEWEFDEEIQAFVPSAVAEYPLVNYWEVRTHG